MRATDHYPSTNDIFIGLVVPYNSPDCLQNARSRKESKEMYQHNLEAKRCLNLSLIGALGHWLTCLCSVLRQQVSSLSKSSATYLLGSAVKAASFRIFCARLNAL